MFRIKICGITRVADARIAALAGADAIGLNFYPISSRCVDLGTADKIVAEVPSRVVKVGVFVNAPVEEVLRIADRLRLDWLQLHGDEPPENLAELGSRPVLKAFRLSEDGTGPIETFLAGCRAQGRLPDAVLLDACREGEFGGTGVTLDWSLVSNARTALGGLPMVLAGGLTPFNVEEAIQAAQPVAVDVASGVESKPGAKDPMLLRAFINSARKAFAAGG